MLYIIGFFLPFYSLSFKIGIEVSLYKIIPFVFLCIYIFSRRRNVSYFTRKDINLLVCLWSYYFIVTLINYIDFYLTGAFENAIVSGQPEFRAYFHMIIQFVTLIMLTSSFLITPKVITNKKLFQSIVGGFIDGNVANVICGVILIVLQKAGLSFSIAQVYYTGSMPRLSGFGGEPRHFASFILVALVLVMLNKKHGLLFRVKSANMKSIILWTGLFFSLSTSAWLGMILALLYLYSRKIKIKQMLIFITAILSVAVISQSSSTISKIIDDRLFSRMVTWEDFLYYAPKDGLVIELIRSNPKLFVFGAGSGGTDYYVMDISFLNTVSKKIINAGIIHKVFTREKEASLTPSSFMIKYIGEYGILGVILFGMVIVNMYKKLEQENERNFYVDFSVSMTLAAIPGSMLLYFVYITIITSFVGAYSNRHSIKN